jgi:hypothetical protein
MYPVELYLESFGSEDLPESTGEVVFYPLETESCSTGNSQGPVYQRGAWDTPSRGGGRRPANPLWEQRIIRENSTTV